MRGRPVFCLFLLHLCHLAGDPAGRSCVVVGKLEIGGEGNSLCHILDVAEKERSYVFAVDALLLSHIKSLYDDLFHLVIIKRVFLGDGVADDKAALKAEIHFVLIIFAASASLSHL